MAKQLTEVKHPFVEAPEMEALYQAERGRVDSEWFPLPSTHERDTLRWLRWLEQTLSR